MAARIVSVRGRAVAVVDLLVLVSLQFLPYLDTTAAPVHDAQFSYVGFEYLYSNLLLHNSIALWIPYVMYGVSANVFHLLITPGGFLAMAGGLLVGATDTLLLYKLGILLDQVYFVVGIYLLGRRVIAHPAARLLFWIGSILSISWIVQPALNFHTYYSLPIVLYFLHRYFQSYRFRDIGLCIFFEAVGLIGNTPYIVPLHLFAVSAYALPLLIENRRAVLSSVRWRQLREPALWLGLVALVPVLVFIASPDAFTQNITPARDPVSSTVSQDVFVSYARYTPARTAFGFLSGLVYHGDNTYYVGLLPLLLLVVGFLWCRSTRFAAAGLSALAVFWLSLGGLFAAAVYWVIPGMMYFRHIGLVFGVGKFLVLLAGALAADELLRRAQRAESLTPRRDQLVRRVFLATFLLMAADFLLTHRAYDTLVVPSIVVPPDASVAPFFARVALYTLGGSTLLWLARRRKRWDTFATPGALVLTVAVFTFDIGYFQLGVLETLPRSRTKSANPVQAVPMAFADDRSDATTARRPWERIEFLYDKRLPNYLNAHYAFENAFARVDRCRLFGRIDQMSLGVLVLLMTQGIAPTAYPEETFIRDQDLEVQRLLRCDGTKVAFVYPPKGRQRPPGTSGSAPAAPLPAGIVSAAERSALIEEMTPEIVRSLKRLPVAPELLIGNFRDKGHNLMITSDSYLVIRDDIHTPPQDMAMLRDTGTATFRSTMADAVAILELVVATSRMEGFSLRRTVSIFGSPQARLVKVTGTPVGDLAKYDVYAFDGRYHGIALADGPVSPDRILQGSFAHSVFSGYHVETVVRAIEADDRYRLRTLLGLADQRSGVVRMASDSVEKAVQGTRYVLLRIGSAVVGVHEEDHPQDVLDLRPEALRYPVVLGVNKAQVRSRIRDLTAVTIRPATLEAAGGTLDAARAHGTSGHIGPSDRNRPTAEVALDLRLRVDSPGPDPGMEVRSSQALDAPASNGGASTWHIESFVANSVRFRATNATDASAWLTYADAWHPRWRALVDGVERPLDASDIAFKAISVPPGAHTITFEYRDPVRQFLCLAMAAFSVLAYAVAILSLRNEHA